jgi:succinate-acetate transporter protein
MSNLDIDLEKGTVEYKENVDSIDEESPRIKPRDTNRTYNTTINEDGDTIFFGDMAIDRKDFMKLIPQQQAITVEQSNWRPLGNPVPLGLCGYGISTFTLGLVLMEARGATNPKLLICSSLTFSGLVTLISGLWCLMLDNTFAATALGAFGGFYLSYAVILIDGFGIASSYETTKEFNDVMAFWLTGWTIYAFVMWLNTFKGTVDFCVLIGIIVLYLITLTAHYYTGSHALKITAGAFAFLSSLIAFYDIWSMNAIEETSHVIPPTWMMPGHAKKSKKL